MSPCTVGCCSSWTKEYPHAPTQTIIENITHSLKRLDTKGHASYDPVYIEKCRLGKSIEGESRYVVSGARGEEKMEKMVCGYEYSFEGNENFTKKFSVSGQGWCQTQDQLLTAAKASTQDTSVIFDLQYYSNFCCTA